MYLTSVFALPCTSKICETDVMPNSYLHHNDCPGGKVEGRLDL